MVGKDCCDSHRRVPRGGPAAERGALDGPCASVCRRADRRLHRAGVRDVFEQTPEADRGVGGSVEAVSLPQSTTASQVYSSQPEEAARTSPATDGVPSGIRRGNGDLLPMYEETRGQARRGGEARNHTPPARHLRALLGLLRGLLRERAEVRTKIADGLRELRRGRLRGHADLTTVAFKLGERTGRTPDLRVMSGSCTVPMSLVHPRDLDPRGPQRGTPGRPSRSRRRPSREKRKKKKKKKKKKKTTKTKKKKPPKKKTPPLAGSTTRTRASGRFGFEGTQGGSERHYETRNSGLDDPRAAPDAHEDVLRLARFVREMSRKRTIADLPGHPARCP